eukprot:scaffold1183_cov114-Cylindrotheca_fusiformis.AAC.1
MIRSSNRGDAMNRHMQPSASAAAVVVAIQDQAEVAAGIASQHQQHNASILTADQLRRTLNNLRDAKTSEDAHASMLVLDQALDSHAVLRKQTAERISNLYGVSTILVTFTRMYSQDSDFCGVVIHFLVNMTYLLPNTIPLIVAAGLRTVQLAATTYPKDYVVSSNTVGLLHNCSEYDHDIRLEVSKDSCLDIVVRAMLRWPTSSYHQERGSLYFYEMSLVPKARKTLLEEKNVCSILANALDHFRNVDNTGVFQTAQRTLMVFYYNDDEDSSTGPDE